MLLTLYVAAAALEGGDGTSWETAFTHLQDALARAELEIENAGVGVGDDNDDDEEELVRIFVARGSSYTPDLNNADRSATFRLLPQVSLFGGFAGTESSPDERDFLTGGGEEQLPTAENTLLTVLTGDIGDVGESSDNSQHVVTGASDALLDGFFITGGFADGANGTDPNGGGMLNKGPDDSLEGCSPTVTNCVFAMNSAVGGDGGAMFNWHYASPSIANCLFYDNSAEFQVDRGGNGGAISSRLGSSFSVSDTYFVGNSATESGGALSVDYGLAPSVESSTFSGNTAGKHGGALFAIDRASQLGKTEITLSGATSFDGNQAGVSGGAMCFWDSAAFLVTMGSLISHAISVDGSNTARTMPSRVSCFGCGNDEGWPALLGLTEDDVVQQDLQAPQIDTDGLESITAAADALETLSRGSPALYSSAAAATVIHYVDAKASTAGDGSRWSLAYQQLQHGLASASSGDEVWVASGTYTATDGSFVVPSDVSVFGGFAGAESDLTQRKLIAGTTSVLMGCEAGHVIQLNDGSLLDGFIVTGGAAPPPTTLSGPPGGGSDGPPSGGGGRGGGGDRGGRGGSGGGRGQQHTNPLAILSQTTTVGGGILVHGGSSQTDLSSAVRIVASVVNVVVFDNWSIKGGGLYVFLSTLNMANVAFIRNTAQARGGGLAGDMATIKCHNCLFEGNTVSGKGGGVYGDFGIYGIFYNSEFRKNSAANGGGGVAIDGSSTVVVEDGCSVTDNESGGSGDGLYQGTYQPFAHDEQHEPNSIFIGADIDVADEVFSWGYDDLFVDDSSSGVFGPAHDDGVIETASGRAVTQDDAVDGGDDDDDVDAISSAGAVQTCDDLGAVSLLERPLVQGAILFALAAISVGLGCFVKKLKPRPPCCNRRNVPYSELDERRGGEGGFEMGGIVTARSDNSSIMGRDDDDELFEQMPVTLSNNIGHQI